MQFNKYATKLATERIPINSIISHVCIKLYISWFYSIFFF